MNRILALERNEVAAEFVSRLDTTCVVSLLGKHYLSHYAGPFTHLPQF
jgi:hypothetical protein